MAMSEESAKRLAKRKNDLPGHKKSSDGWFYQATKKPAGWVVERRRTDGHGWTLWRSSLD